MSTKSPLQERWTEVWKKYLEQFSAHNTSWANDSWREPFQLLGASLIYTFNAMEVMLEGMFHEAVRPNKRDSQEIWKLFNGKNPDFRQNADEQFNELVSTMHMASSSFRLPTALYLMEKEMLNKAKGRLTELLKDSSSDWERNKLEDYRTAARKLKCCKENKSLNTHLDSEKIALAMILDHRDEFGHGDEGHKIRSLSIPQFHLCRIFEAQLLLAELGVDQLAKIK